MQSILKNQCDAFLTLARRYCNDNAEHWYRDYESKRSSSLGYSDEDYDRFPRYKTLDAIRMEVESLLDMSFASLEECRCTLVAAGQTAESLFTKGHPKHYREALAVQDEREKFVNFIQGVKDAELLGVEPLPYARRLRDTESEELRKRLRERWNYTGTYWVPLGDSCPEPYCFLAFENMNDDDIDRITSLVVSVAAGRIYRFNEDWIDYELEKTSFKLDGNETVYIDAGFDWIVYVSHEGTATFGGQVLADFVARLFSERKEMLNRWPKTLAYSEDRCQDGPLHFAIKINDEKLFAKALQPPVDVNLKGQFNKTPLHRAAMSGQTDFVRLLLDAGADMDVTDNFGKTPLNLAVAGNHTETVSLLIERGADKNKSFPLHLAAKLGLTEILEILLAAGTDVNQIDWYHNTPLFYAVEHRKPEAVDLLLRYGADPNSGERNDTFPLFRAARNGDVEIARKLIQAGADVNRADGSGWTSLHTAAVQGHVDVVDLLLEAGAILEMRNQYGWTPLFLAAGSGQKAVVEKQLAAGANIETKDAKGLTPLENARKNGHLEVVLLLQEAEGKLPKDLLIDPLVTNRWQELFWTYPAAKEPYTNEQWQEILDGLLDSFNRQLLVRFIHAEPPRLYLENEHPCVVFNIICSTPNPLGALNLYAIGSVNTFNTDDGKVDISADISLFVFLNESRLKAESRKNTAWTNDYIVFHFVKQPDGEVKWECRDWESGFEGEWNGIEFPQKFASTNQLQVVLPNKDDERYDPVKEMVELQTCPRCGQDYAYPWTISANRELIWICRECEAAWKKHAVFTQDNMIDFEWPELEELPYQNIIEDVPHYGTYPPEASHISLFSSNRFTVYECQMPQDCFEKLAHASCWKMEQINRSVCIPRYHFRSFLEEQRRLLSIEELRRRLPDSPFIHRTEQGFECRQKRGKRSTHVVYDLHNSTLYYYFFVESTDDKIGQKELRFHETLMKLCRDRSSE